MNDLLGGVMQTTELVNEITASSTEQLRGAEQVSAAIQELNFIAQQNAASSEELAAGSNALSQQAENLRRMIAFFKVSEK